VSRSLVVDTDGGTDDAVALWWALGEPRVELAGVVASAGNVDRVGAAANVGRILRAADRLDVPVALGAEGPVASAAPAGAGRASRAVRARAVHGHDGLGGFADRWPVAAMTPGPEAGAELVARLTCRRPGEIDLVTLGPLTTLAAALRIDPGIASRVRTLTVMGGVLGSGGHVVTAGESNVGHDPAAAAQVLATPWATVEPPLLVALDVTRRTLLSPDDLVLAAAGRTVAARFVADPLRRYARYYAQDGQAPPGSAPGALPCHDLLAIMAAVDPAVITEAPERRLTVDGSVGPPGVPWRVALAADVLRFRTAFRTLAGAPTPDSLTPAPADLPPGDLTPTDRPAH
jgi:purine nucleosidase